METIGITLLLGCDKCGGTIEQDECLCSTCKQELRERDKREAIQIERDCLQLVEVNSRPIAKPWEEIPDEPDLMTSADFEPIGLRCETLIFESHSPESRYYGRNFVPAVVSVNHKPVAPLQSCWDDFADVLRRS
jgi:hypothetical protein